MSKKRVHEITKELKNAGVELDNKEVVTELLALGYDVKSFSSSLDDDQANAAIQKIVDKRKPKAAPPPVAARGFVVRRKPGAEGAGAPAPAQVAAAAAGETAPAPSAAVPPQAPEPEAAVAPAPAVAESAPVVTAPAAPVVSEPSATVAPASPAAALPAAVPATPPVAPAATPSVPAAPQAGTPQPVAAPSPTAPRPAVPPSVRPAVVVPPSVVRPTAPGQVTAAGAAGATTAHPGVPAAAAQPAVDPRTLKPTATQAVVISRPLIQVRRVTPASNAHKNIPVAPGRKAIGEVRELKVVPDGFGRGKDFVDVSKNKDKRPTKRTPEKDGAPSRQEITDLMFGRVALPLRGKKKKPTKKGLKTQITQMSEDKKVIKLQEGITVSDLAQRMGVRIADIIKKLMTGGKMATANQMVDVDTAEIIAADYGWKVEKVGFEVEDMIPEVEDRDEDNTGRPPVVTVMGHVDHGKTSLLDALRQANVAAGEAGGITQHIGAYTVSTDAGDITFLDTPGHEAFSAMRSRGANITDIVILVVAADDGVMPQTREAIQKAREAEVPLVVAINKVDLPGANPDRVKKELADQNVLAEDWGGDVQMVPVSAKKRQNLELLLENVLLQAEVLDLKANPTLPAVGTILEAKLEKGRGPVASVLVQEGTLRLGDAVVSGVHYGRVRALRDDLGNAVEEIKPGYSAEVIGLSGVPTAGDVINAVADERAAKEIAEHRAFKARQVNAAKTSKDTLDGLLARMKQSDQKELRVVLKADVQGSLEAVADAVLKLSGPKVKVDIVHKGVGMMTETDVMMASATKALVVGFNSRPESGAEATAKAQEVELVTFSIIYELLDGIRARMEDLLEPIRTEKKLGRAEVRNLFNVPKLGTIAGSSILEGKVTRAAFARLWRGGKQVYAGKVASLRRFKDDVKEVAQGFECGIGLDNCTDLQPGDIIEAYEVEETRQSLT
jgi:translation initiation factor IF-2